MVNEAYLRLSHSGDLKPDDRYRYLAYVGRAMRSVVIDYIRARAAERRGGRAHHMSIDTQIADSVPGDEAHVLQVHEALEELASVDARMVQVVEMKYFAGLGERDGQVHRRSGLALLGHRTGDDDGLGTVVDVDELQVRPQLAECLRPGGMPVDLHDERSASRLRVEPDDA